MKSPSAKRAFSTWSACLLFVAVVSALVSVIRAYEPFWLVAQWVCGISVVALVVSLIVDARK